MDAKKLVGLPGGIWVNPLNLLYMEDANKSSSGRPCVVLRMRDGCVKTIYGDPALSPEDFAFAIAKKFEAP